MASRIRAGSGIALNLPSQSRSARALSAVKPRKGAGSAAKGRMERAAMPMSERLCMGLTRAESLLVLTPCARARNVSAEPSLLELLGRDRTQDHVGREPHHLGDWIKQHHGHQQEDWRTERE